MAVSDWSTTAASNATQPGINWAEGQLPGTVNGSARQMMADIATWYAEVNTQFGQYIDLTSVAAITTTTTLTSSAFGLAFLVQGTSANYTITLPAVSGNAGKLIAIVVDFSATKLFTFNVTGGSNIDRDASKIMWSGETALFYCDGTRWRTLQERRVPFNGFLYRASSLSFSTGSTWVQVPLTGAGGDQALLNMPWDSSNNCFSAPRKGQYDFTASLSVTATAASDADLDLGLEVNGSTAPMAPGNYPNSFRREVYRTSAARQMIATAVHGVSLSAGDKVRPIVRITAAGASPSVEYSAGTLVATLGYREN